MSRRKWLLPAIGTMLAILLIAGCGAATPIPEPATPTTISPTNTPEPPTSTPNPPTSTPEPTSTSAPVATTVPETTELWEDATKDTIGVTGEWTNKVELADINSDGLVDILFANGGDYEAPGTPVMSRVLLNQGPGIAFEDVSEVVFGPEKMLARVIKVRDVNGDRQPDILVGTTYQTQSRLYLGDGNGAFTDVTATHLPQINASIGDLEIGDVDDDGDVDIVLADWGSGDPMYNEGGRTMLWLNDGTGHFSDVTGSQMPDILVKFSWELEFIDVDNDYDLDIAISCKKCTGSFLFENDQSGNFIDVTDGRLPQFSNNYEFEPMDLNGDTYLDLVTINDGFYREHMFINDAHGGFENANSQLWRDSENPSYDDNMVAFLDFDSDGDADFLIGSLDGPDRLLINDGTGRLTVDKKVFKGPSTPGTLAIALADLNGDHKLDVVQAQGEAAVEEKVFLGTNILPDTAPPVITLVEQASMAESGEPISIRARVHDNKSPTMPYDWQSVALRWTADGQTQETTMQWYGEYLWRGTIDQPAGRSLSYQVCATDAAGNSACSETMTAAQ